MRTRALVLIAVAAFAYLGLVQFVPAQESAEKGTHHGGWREMD